MLVYIVRTPNRARRDQGSALAEMPAALYLIFIGLAIPLIGLTLFGLRAALIYFSVRDTCYHAAKSSTFSNAKANAATTWAADSKLWGGVTGVETTYVVVHPLNNGPETIQATPLPPSPAPDPSTANYFIRVVSTCSIQPFFGGSWIGMDIPGLTVPYNMQISYQYYAENPSGLTQ